MTDANPLASKSLFPDMPRGEMISDKEGKINSLYQLFLDKVVTSLQHYFKSEGILFPSMTATQIAAIQATYAPYVGGPYNTLILNLQDITGQTVVDSDNRIIRAFIITLDTSTPPNVLTAAWKTYTLT